MNSASGKTLNSFSENSSYGGSSKNSGSVASKNLGGDVCKSSAKGTGKSSGRIAAAFAGGKAFIGFVTGGDPSLADSERYIISMIEAGADLIEIGIPFSDPIAEGSVIQEADLRALSAGTRIADILALAARLRAQTEVPLVFMTYLNPVFHYGYDAFFAAAAQAGVDGIIIPDLPYEERGELLPAAQAWGIELISMIAPTSAQRVSQIAAEATGFIYLVSSLGVTGVRPKITTDLAALIATIRAVTSTPVAIGFGIHQPEQARELASLADGVIVGSEIVRRIAAATKAGNPAAANEDIATFVREMKIALKGA